MTSDRLPFENWVEKLAVDVIQQEYGYEPGEFEVFPEHWRPFYEDGLTPKQAFDRALRAYDAERKK